MLPNFFVTKRKHVSVLEKLLNPELKRRNVDYAHEWSYTSLSRNLGELRKVYLRKRAVSPLIKFFCKRTNQNKLYVWYSRNIFITPGIVVRYANDNYAQLKFLKKRGKTWANTTKALLPLLPSKLTFEFDNLFGKKEILLKRLTKKRFSNCWYIFRLFFLNFAYGKKPKRRIKRWIKKKYYRLSVNENK